MPSSYRIQTKVIIKRSKKVLNTNSDNNSHRQNDLKKTQMTLNDFVKPDTNTKSNKRNKIL